MISVVAWCHGAKICAHAARDFQSQQHQSCLVAILEALFVTVNTVEHTNAKLLSGDVHSKTLKPQLKPLHFSHKAEHVVYYSHEQGSHKC